MRNILATGEYREDEDVHNKLVKSWHNVMELCWIICLHSLEGADMGCIRANECITVEVCSLANASLVLKEGHKWWTPVADNATNGMGNSGSSSPWFVLAQVPISHMQTGKWWWATPVSTNSMSSRVTCTDTSITEWGWEGHKEARNYDHPHHHLFW